MAKRRFIGGVILALALIGSVIAEPPTTVVIGTLPQPGWDSLSPPQKSILAPLAADWNSMENLPRKKWLGIAERYPNMKPDEQRRIQQRMREWASLTPEQRSKVRGTYKDFNQLPPEQKAVVKQKWEAYSNLPSDEKQRIRESGKSGKLLQPAPPTEAAPPSVSQSADGSSEAPTETAKP
ncbi:DUF3106 domain-containing protein [Dechloromonas denitrificans]|uniref:DUF3106 domain-containing protein n=1 Tax=Dechloromonas denitrificans TaxID=281362 RepID=UPI0009F864F5|nr:DUF3106 domain-containing protein [Dechloromonas denitrificans]